MRRMQKYVVIFQAPIPVGHRVELVWYEVVVDGLFGTSRKERPHEPVITDLDTGIVYVSDRLLVTPGMKRPKEPLEVSDGLDGDAKEVRRVRGVVRACRVVTIRSFSDVDLQTELTIAPEG
jgi:NAD(P)H-hydrate repair Nnr-like enzyme with NAD(P)H-hydrate epimerase domain